MCCEIWQVDCLKIIYFLLDVVKLIITDNEQGEESRRKLVINRPFFYGIRSPLLCLQCLYSNSTCFLMHFPNQDWHQDKHGVEHDSRRYHSTLSQSSGFHMVSDANLNKSGSCSCILDINRSFLGCDTIILGFQCITSLKLILNMNI